jgi:hypothetical protein
MEPVRVVCSHSCGVAKQGFNFFFSAELFDVLVQSHDFENFNVKVDKSRDKK